MTLKEEILANLTEPIISLSVDRGVVKGVDSQQFTIKFYNDEGRLVVAYLDTAIANKMDAKNIAAVMGSYVKNDKKRTAWKSLD